MEIHEDGYVDPKDGLTYDAENSCWLSPADVAKRGIDLAKVEAKEKRERTKRERAATKALERTWILVNVGRYADRGELTLAYRGHFGKTRSRVATLHKEINDVLTDDGIRLRAWAPRTFRGGGVGIADVPDSLKAINQEEAR